MPSPLYSASLVVFQLHGGWVSHMQALATPSTVHNTWILTTESISVLAACTRENPSEEVDYDNYYYYE